MSYSGGCLFGWVWLVPGFTGTNYVGGRTTSLAGLTPTAAQSGLQSADEETRDGCWLPVEWAINETPGGATSYMQMITDMTQLIHGDQYGLLFSYHVPSSPQMPNVAPSNYRIYTSPNASTAFSEITTATILNQPKVSYEFNGIATGHHVLVTGLPSGITAIEADGLLSTWKGNGGLWGEFVSVSLQEFPNNQELVSFRREIKNPSQQIIRTLDGSQRVFKTGPCSVEMSATWRWSDNGAFAATLNAQIDNAARYGCPFFVYIPAGIWFTGPFLDIVIPSVAPTITMPAPGVYEFTLTGECQP